MKKYKVVFISTEDVTKKGKTVTKHLDNRIVVAGSKSKAEELVKAMCGKLIETVFETVEIEQTFEEMLTEIMGE